MTPLRFCQSLTLFAVLLGGTLALAGPGDTPTTLKGSVQPGRRAAVSPGLRSERRQDPEDPTASESQMLEKQMLELVNRDRLNPSNISETRGQARSLEWNDRLVAVAREYSKDMVTRGFFSHVSPEGVSPDARVTAAGIEWQAEGENIAIYSSVAAAQSAFMNEPRFQPNHRANILDSKFTDIGIGIVKGPDGRYYITQEFIEAPGDSHVGAQNASLEIPHTASSSR